MKQCAWTPMGNKIRLSIHLRNFGSRVNIRLSVCLRHRVTNVRCNTFLRMGACGKKLGKGVVGGGGSVFNSNLMSQVQIIVS